ncbi:MAG: hypothetical protein WBC65_16610, partial [Ignavibacteria bacterium]
MKKIFLSFLLVVFACSAIAQQNNVPGFIDKTQGIDNYNFQKEHNGEFVAVKTKDFTFTINPYIWFTG